MTHSKIEESAPSMREGHARVRSRVRGFVRNIFISHYRRHVSNATTAHTSDDLYRLDPATGTSLADTHPAKRIIKLLNRSDASHRRPFVLYVKGHKCVEISKQLHLPVNTVKSRIHYIIRRLKSPPSSRED